MICLGNIFLEFNAVIDHGGIVLWLMLILSVILYSTLSSTWLGIIDAKKDIRQLINNINKEHSEEDVITDVTLFELDKLAWVQRRVPVLSVMITLSPLAGLLGTVSGLLTTFSGMASDSTTKPIDIISSGISEALVTTQAGLLMAIPAALIFAPVSYTHLTLPTIA